MNLETLPPVSTDSSVSIDWMEEMLDDSCLCESKHSPGTSSPYCSILATHRITQGCAKMSALICQSLAAANVLYMGNNIGHCIDCGNRASECWRITLL